MNLLTGIFVALCLTLSCAGAADPAHIPADSFQIQIRPVVDEFCGKCHNSVKAKGGVNLASFTNLVSVYREPQVWEKVLAKVKANEMPPEDKPQPTEGQRAALTNWVARSLDDLAQGRFARGRRMDRQRDVLPVDQAGEDHDQQKE